MKQNLFSILFFLLVTCMAFGQVTGLSGWDICLDPGHSRTENMGIYNYSEAERNVRVALRLREMLLSETDIDTVFITRTDDIQSVSLSQRTDYANLVGASWFHSIHSNAGSPSVNNTLLLWGQYENNQEKVPNGGKAMSDVIINVLTAGMRIPTIGSWGDHQFYGTCPSYRPCPYLWVNYYTSMPSELSESGFHTNPRQNQLFMNDDWKRLEARTFFWSILDFFQIPRPTVRILTGIISDFESGVPVNGAEIKVEERVYTTDTFASLFYKYTSDPDLLHNGLYYFEDIAGDIPEMFVSAEGYYADTITVAMVDNFFTFRDIQLISSAPPFLVTSNPAEGDSAFPIWDPIVLDFSRPIDTTLTSQAISFDPPTQINYLWTDNRTRLTIYPDTLYPETAYVITISGELEDLYGHTFDGNKDGVGGDNLVLSFTSSPPDIFAPVISEVYPPQVATNIELHPIINIVYDELIVDTLIAEETVRLQRLKDNSYIAGTLVHYEVNEQSVLCFYPFQQLEPDETYIIRVSAGVTDLFGNTTLVPSSYSFRTGVTSLITTNIDNFEYNLTSNWFAPQQSGSTTGIITELTSRSAAQDVVNLATESGISLRINYGWDVLASYWLLREYLSGGAPKGVEFDENYLLQVYVFGDGSGTKFRFALDDNLPATAAAYHEVSPWFTIDWMGWRLISWDMVADGTGTWIGDGVLDGRLRFDSIQLSYEPGSAISGRLYFDDLRLAETVSSNLVNSAAKIPQNNFLSQNYPNPFNASTSIKFGLSSNTHVKLDLYDVTGKHITTVIDRMMGPGFYTEIIDARVLASGIYIYTLQTNDIRLSRRMTLIK